MSSRTKSRTRQTASRNLDAVLDEALLQTFPASDPFSVGRITGVEPPRRPVDRQAPVIDTAAVAKARRGRGRRST